MANIVLLSVLLVPILIFVLFAAPARASISLRKARLVLGVYLSILLVSVPVFYAVARPGVPDSVEITEIGPGRYSYEDPQINDYYDALHQGRLGQYPGAQTIARWDFDYQEERLFITAPDYQQYSTNIYIEEKDARDGNLEIYCYAPKLPNRITLANPPKIQLQGNQLQIMSPEKMHLEAVQFYQDFTMVQFTDQGTFWGRFDFPGPTGHMVLYMRVPDGIQLEADQSVEQETIFLRF